MIHAHVLRARFQKYARPYKSKRKGFKIARIEKVNQDTFEYGVAIRVAGKICADWIAIVVTIERFPGKGLVPTGTEYSIAI